MFDDAQMRGFLSDPCATGQSSFVQRRTIALMRRLWIAAVSVALAGTPAPGAAGLLSATGNVIAIMGGELFLGEAEGHLNGAGTLTIHSQQKPALTCTGQFTSSAEQGGKGELVCANGSRSTFHFTRLTIRRGYGAGSFGRGSMSFTYGLSAAEAGRYLKLPKGKKLAHNGKELELVDA